MNQFQNPRHQQNKNILIFCYDFKFFKGIAELRMSKHGFEKMFCYIVKCNSYWVSAEMQNIKIWVAQSVN